MKKIIACLLICVLFVPVVSVSEQIDLSGYSEEELNYMIQAINEELVKRKGTECWFDYGIGQYIPKMELVSGKEPKLDSFVINSDSSLSVTVKNSTDEDFENYIQKLMSFGFTEKVERSNTDFRARNKDNIKITVINFGSSGITVSAKK